MFSKQLTYLSVHYVFEGYLIFLRAGPHVHSNEVSSNKRRSERVDVDIKD